MPRKEGRGREGGSPPLFPSLAGRLSSQSSLSAKVAPEIAKVSRKANSRNLSQRDRATPHAHAGCKARAPEIDGGGITRKQMMSCEGRGKEGEEGAIPFEFTKLPARRRMRGGGGGGRGGRGNCLWNYFRRSLLEKPYFTRRKEAVVGPRWGRFRKEGRQSGRPLNWVQLR